MFQRFGKDAFAEEKRLIALRRMISRYFVLLIGEGSPEVDRPVARGGLFPVAQQFYSSGFASNGCHRPTRFRRKREKRTTNLTSEFRVARKPVHVQEEAPHGCKRHGRLARTL
jgi:hypothetical protein